MQLFVTCQQSLEPLLAQELRELGMEGVTEGFRGVALPYSMKNIFIINYLSRIAGRVLLPLVEFPLHHKGDLYKAGKEVPWEKYFTRTTTFAIDVRGKHAVFNNTLYAAQLLKDAICDRLRSFFGSRPDVCVATPDIQLSLFLSKKEATISFDTSGEPLFKRGYRKETGEAPMQESFAAALLRMAKYTGEEVLVDPCCGSGTILTEAALMATKTPPGYFRKKWGFFYLPEFDRGEWDNFCLEENKKIEQLPLGKIYGIDINPMVVKKARANSDFAGFSNVQIDCKDITTLPDLPLPANLVICNPPHGERLGEEEKLEPLYRSLGDFFKRRLVKPARAFIFTTSLPLSKKTGLKADIRTPLMSSGEESRLLFYNIY